MEKTFEKSEKVLGVIKNYLVPLIVFICGLAVAWTALNGNVKINTYAIEDLERRSTKNEEVIDIVLQRLSSIDAKLEYLVKEVDKLNNLSLR